MCLRRWFLAAFLQTIDLKKEVEEEEVSLFLRDGPIVNRFIYLLIRFEEIYYDVTIIIQ